MNRDDLIPTLEVARLFNVGVPTVTRWVKVGRLTPAIQGPGKTGAFLFDRADVDALMAKSAT